MISKLKQPGLARPNMAMGNKKNSRIIQMGRMAEKILWLSGSAIFLVLGSIHLYYTFFTGKFRSRNRAVVTEMKNTSPVLTGGYYNVECLDWL